MKYFYYENKYTAIHISASEKNEYKILIGTFQILSWLAVNTFDYSGKKKQG